MTKKLALFSKCGRDWRYVLLLLSFIVFSPLLFAANLQPLAVDDAFLLKAETFGPDTLILKWKIANQHFIYRDRFKFQIDKPKNAAIGQVLLPSNYAIKHDKILGDHAIFRSGVQISLPIINFDNKKVLLSVTYQGCSDAGYCYPPTTRLIDVNFSTASAVIIDPEKTMASSSKEIELIQSGKLWLIIFSFMGFGILLAFTPCVLPMVPILAGIIFGNKKLTPLHGFNLSLSYVIGMASSYALIGLVFGYFGNNLQTYLQTPIAISIIAAIFILLALAMFGVYRFSVFDSLNNLISHISQKQKSGSFFGVFIMGLLAALIVSPCVTPALFGALTYISTSGNMLIGGLALFSLGLGMGIPLLILGTVGAKFLPKAGPWMQVVEYFLGVLLLIVAIWLISRIIPAWISACIWGAFLMLLAVYLKAFDQELKNNWQRFSKSVGLIAFSCGAVLLTSNLLVHQFRLNSTFAISSQTESTQFITVKSIEQMQQQLRNAKNANKPVMVDFTADWCVSCQLMAANVFTDTKVKNLFEKFVLIKADITAQTSSERELAKKYNVIAPPTLLFFDRNGNELSDQKIIGETSGKNLVNTLQNILMR